jgi:DNA-binding MarR family transcriptional regulator
VITETGSTSVLLSLQRATHRTLHALAAALTDLDLTPSEINTLANLADGRARSVRELAADTGTRATTLTGVLDRLERGGHLTRQLDPADRRSFRVRLTDSGQAVATRVHDAVTGLEREALAGLSADQLAGYHAVVDALQEIR